MKTNGSENQTCHFQWTVGLRNKSVNCFPPLPEYYKFELQLKKLKHNARPRLQEQSGIIFISFICLNPFSSSSPIFLFCSVSLKYSGQKHSVLLLSLFPNLPLLHFYQIMSCYYSAQQHFKQKSNRGPKPAGLDTVPFHLTVSQTKTSITPSEEW